MSRRIEGIDLLRGVAVAAVVGRHALPGVLPGAGVVGVVMFFALSGFLITGVLLDGMHRASESGHTYRLRDFYLRRARRLLPPLVVFLLGFSAVTLLLDPLGDRSVLGNTWWVALTWTANLPFRPETSEASFHLWTLSGEEQFYLFWPLLLLLGVRYRRLGTALAVAGGATVLAVLGTVWWLREDPDLAYVLPTSWAVCFVLGGAARWARDRLPVPGAWTVARAATLLALLCLLEVRGHVWTYLVVGPVVAVATATLLLAVRPEWLAPLWARPVVALGLVSYAAYLWNYPLALWLRPMGWWGPGLAVLLTVLAATASWWLVERPLARRVSSAPAVTPTPARERVPPC